MARSALQVFDRVVAASGLRVREGQRLMAEQVALTFSEADLGKPPEDEDGPIEALEPQRSIAVIQAGTGVGKSLAYSVPAIALALVGEARLEFDVFRGESLVIGETRYHWVHDGQRYRMDTTTETTGLAALLRPLRIDQSSDGDLLDTASALAHALRERGDRAAARGRKE